MKDLFKNKTEKGEKGTKDDIDEDRDVLEEDDSKIDWFKDINLKEHRTDMYKRNDDSLVFRRGQPFKVSSGQLPLNFYRLI